MVPAGHAVIREGWLGWKWVETVKPLLGDGVVVDPARMFPQQDDEVQPSPDAADSQSNE